jgi:hypothetical protein
MKRATRNVLVGYGAFCAVNWAATYYAARSGSPLLLGSAGLLSLNESLRALNLLSRFVDPIALAEKHAAAPAAAAGPQHFVPTAQTVTRFDGGTTTTFG